MVGSFINKLSMERFIQIHKLQRKLPSASWLPVWDSSVYKYVGERGNALPWPQEPVLLMALIPLRSLEDIELGLLNQSLKQQPPGSGGR